MSTGCFKGNFHYNLATKAHIDEFGWQHEKIVRNIETVTVRLSLVLSNGKSCFSTLLQLFGNLFPSRQRGFYSRIGHSSQIVLAKKFVIGTPQVVKRLDALLEVLQYKRILKIDLLAVIFRALCIGKC
jgi:hypothetical protein